MNPLQTMHHGKTIFSANQCAYIYIKNISYSFKSNPMIVYIFNNVHTSVAADSTILMSAFSSSVEELLSPGPPSEASTGSSSVMRI